MAYLAILVPVGSIADARYDNIFVLAIITYESVRHISHYDGNARTPGGGWEFFAFFLLGSSQRMSIRMSLHMPYAHGWQETKDGRRRTETQAMAT